MRASEWQFLCAVHDPPKPCCAIDYCCHTLDWATDIVTSPKIFPSRLSLGSGDMVTERSVGVKYLANIFRRIHRIFAHAWFQHRQVYWSVESSTGLYTLFKIICDTYELMPTENTKLPPEAEGLEAIEEQRPVISILKPTQSTPCELTAEDDYLGSVGRTKTRRHIRQSPSVGSAVTTVLEADEDGETVKQSLDDYQDQAWEREVEVPPSMVRYEFDDDDVITVKDGRSGDLREDSLQEEIESKEEFSPISLDAVHDRGDPSAAVTSPTELTEINCSSEQDNELEDLDETRERNVIHEVDEDKQ